MSEQALYQKLLVKPYPEHQYMDAESVGWLKENLEIKEAFFAGFDEKYSRFPLEKIEVDIDAFNHYNGKGIHGFRHQFRVMLYIWLLVRMLKIDIDGDILADLLQAALYHDILRENDNSDFGHGERSADWIKEHYPSACDKAIDAVRFHDKYVEKGEMDINISLLKTADAIDRYRLPKKKWWIDLSYINFEIPVEYLNFFKYITYYTEVVAYQSDNVEDMKKEMLKWLRRKKIV